MFFFSNCYCPFKEKFTLLICVRDERFPKRSDQLHQTFKREKIKKGDRPLVDRQFPKKNTKIKNNFWKL